MQPHLLIIVGDRPKLEGNCVESSVEYWVKKAEKVTVLTIRRPPNFLIHLVFVKKL